MPPLTRCRLDLPPFAPFPLPSLQAGQPGVQINVRSLLLTLIEIASAMGYLHSMGVVHCGEE